jgi:3-oxoacyl-[acyl-carrier-protein] synthase-3
MALSRLEGCGIAGISVRMPRRIQDNLLEGPVPEKDRAAYVQATGIRFRRIAEDGVSSGDLCAIAAESLLNKLDWDKSQIRVLVFISQTPDYLIPNTSSLLQNRLGLSKDCMAMDVNLGCSGYVYGLHLLMSLLNSMEPGAKGLLLVGDVSSRCTSPLDKSVYPIFSDGGSATALMRDDSGPSWFNLQTDGSGWQQIMIPDGGMRSPFNEASLMMEQEGEGVIRNRLHMRLDGIGVFHFAQKEVLPNLNKLLEFAGKKMEDAKFVIVHQANKLIIENLRKKAGVNQERWPMILHDFGNASSASIPLALVKTLGDVTEDCQLLLSGFGVGLSWGGGFISLKKGTVLDYGEC